MVIKQTTKKTHKIILYELLYISYILKSKISEKIIIKCNLTKMSPKKQKFDLLL